MKNSGYKNTYGTNSQVYKSQNNEKLGYDDLIKNSKSIKPDTYYKGANIERAKTIKHNSKKAGKMLTSFVAILSGALALTGASSLVPNKNDIGAEFRVIYTTENEVYYYVDFDTDIQGEDLSVVLYNDFTNREQSIDGEYYSGIFEHLSANMYYTLAVNRNGKELISKRIKTTNQTDTKYWYGEPIAYIEEDPISKEREPNSKDDIPIGNDIDNEDVLPIADDENNRPSETEEITEDKDKQDEDNPREEYPTEEPIEEPNDGSQDDSTDEPNEDNPTGEPIEEPNGDYEDNPTGEGDNQPKEEEDNPNNDIYDEENIDDVDEEDNDYEEDDHDDADNNDYEDESNGDIEDNDYEEDNPTNDYEEEEYGEKQ